MSQLTQTLTKKRKHSLQMALEAPTSTPSKKLRSEKTGAEKVKKKKDKNKEKGKSKGSAASEFRVVSASLVVSIAPVFASNPRGGVEEMLDSMVMR
jgi:DNA-directed RNA polymerase I subunit RPA43